MKLELDCRHPMGSLDLTVNTAIPLDRITGLFGPSGAGKTTLLRIIAGLEPGSTGRVRFDDAVWQSDSPRVFVPPHRRRIGYVFQDMRLFSHLSVQSNIRYGLKRRQETIKYDDVVEALDLAPLLSRKPVSLSGGEQQRVAIGRALLSQPCLLLMDEPVSALDLPRRKEVLRYLQRLPEIFQVPIIYVTHAIEEIAQLAHSVIVLSRGEVVKNGTVTEVFGDTDLSGLMGHIGAESLLVGTVMEHDPQFHHSVVKVGDQQIVIPGTGRKTGSTVRLQIHARDVSIALKRPEQISIRNILKVTVTGLTDKPDSAYIEVQLDLNGNRLRSLLTRFAVKDLDLQVGQSVYALIKGVSFDQQA
jgi:molybdate transport system ATP-binding protein